MSDVPSADKGKLKKRERNESKLPVRTSQKNKGPEGRNLTKPKTSFTLPKKAQRSENLLRWRPVSTRFNAVLVLSLFLHLGFRDIDDKLKKPVYFTWVSVCLGILFVVVHMFQMFGTWHDIDWGVGDNKVSVRFVWEARASLLYASVVVSKHVHCVR